MTWPDAHFCAQLESLPRDDDRRSFPACHRHANRRRVPARKDYKREIELAHDWVLSIYECAVDVYTDGTRKYRQRLYAGCGANGSYWRRNRTRREPREMFPVSRGFLLPLRLPAPTAGALPNPCPRGRAYAMRASSAWIARRRDSLGAPRRCRCRRAHRKIACISICGALWERPRLRSCP